MWFNSKKFFMHDTIKVSVRRQLFNIYGEDFALSGFSHKQEADLCRWWCIILNVTIND